MPNIRRTFLHVAPVVSDIVVRTSATGPLTTTTGLPEPSLASDAKLQLQPTPQSDVLAGAYIITFEDTKPQAEDFLPKVENATGAKASLRKSFSGTLLDAISIQLENVDEHVDAKSLLSEMPGVSTVDPVHVYPVPPPINPHLEFVDGNTSKPLVKRQRPLPDGASSTHLMAQVDKLRAEGFTGKGVKIAIIDAPIDSTHPALRVSFEKSWLEDVDVGNPDPNCKTHATALAGVIAAQENSLGFTGVAPGVEMGSYAIRGCTIGGNDEKLIAAMEQAITDNVNILIYSAGFGNGWSSLALNLVFNRVVERGVMITTGAGNAGDIGIFNSFHPSDARNTLGVGSVDNDKTLVLANISSYSTDQDSSEGKEFVWRDGEAGVPNTVGWNDAVLPLWTNVEDRATGCKPLPDTTPDLSQHIVFLRRDGCADVDVARQAGLKNARYLIIGNDDPGLRVEVPRVTESSIEAIAMVDQNTSDAWTSLLQSGVKVLVNTTTSPNLKKQLVSDGWRTGRMSGFSQWGPSWDGFMATSVSAPGADILTTAPVGAGSSLYHIVAGTSVANPFAAGVAALVAEVRGTKDWKVLSSLLATTAKPLVRAVDRFDDKWDDPGNELASVAQQGGGLVQAFNAAFAPSVLSVKDLHFNDTDHRKTVTFTITNESPEAITYKLSNIPAGTVYTFTESNRNEPARYNDIMNDLYTKDAASIDFPSGATVTVSGNGGSASVEVRADDPANVNLDRLPVWSGWIALNGSDSFNYTVPYLGIGGSSDNTPTVYYLAWRLTDPNAGPGEEPRPIIEPGRTVQMPAEEPILHVGIGMGTRKVRWELIDANSGKSMGQADLFDMDRASRGHWLLSWGGKLRGGSRVQNGTFKLVAKSLKTFASSEENESDWKTLDGPVIRIAWTD